MINLICIVIILLNFYKVTDSILFGNYSYSDGSQRFELDYNVTSNTIFYKSADRFTSVEMSVSNNNNKTFLDSFHVLSDENQKLHFKVTKNDYMLKQTHISGNDSTALPHHKEFYLESNHQLKEIFIILDTEPHDEDDKKTLEYWRTWQMNVFPLGVHNIKIWEWPPIFTKPCPSSNVVSHRSRTKERGINLVHHQIYGDFMRRHKGIESNEHKWKYKDDVALILESDSFCRTDDCGRAIIDAISTMKSDIMYLGWCDTETVDTMIPPYCTHAYVITASACQKLYQLIDPCDEALDLQLKKLAGRQAFTSSKAVKYHFAEHLNKNRIPNMGLFIQN